MVFVKEWQLRVAVLSWQTAGLKDARNFLFQTNRA